MAIRKMCAELGLGFGRCTEDAKAMLKEQNINSPTTAQLTKALDKIEDKHHAILFLHRPISQGMGSTSNNSKTVC